MTQLQEGQWQARADVHDKVKDKSIPLSVSFKAEAGQSLRMDITTSTGIYVGSVLVKKEKFSALIAREKKFYQGPSSAGAMQKVIRVPVDPSWLESFLFEVPPADWKCEYDKQGFLSNCAKDEQNLSVRWSDRKGDRKLIQIEGKTFRLKLFLGRFFAKVQNKEKAFQLKSPQGFKIITIR